MSRPNCVIEFMKRNGIEITRANYKAINWMGTPPPQLDPEELAEEEEALAEAEDGPQTDAGVSLVEICVVVAVLLLKNVGALLARQARRQASGLGRLVKYEGGEPSRHKSRHKPTGKAGN